MKQAAPKVTDAIIGAFWEEFGHAVPAIDIPAGSEAIWATLVC